MISQDDLDKAKEIARLHDEAFWHLHKFDGHAKSGDGNVSIELGLGTVWDRQDGPVEPTISVNIYSYVVASDTPSYPNFGQRSHYFESVDQALDAMRDWHAEAMAYNPSEADIAEANEMASDVWEVVKDKTTIYELKNGETTQVWPPKRFRDKANGE